MSARTCVMCNGTGRDFRYVTEPAGACDKVIDRVPVDDPCRVCRGRGVEE